MYNKGDKVTIVPKDTHLDHVKEKYNKVLTIERVIPGYTRKYKVSGIKDYALDSDLEPVCVFSIQIRKGPMIKQPTLSFSLDCTKMIIALRKTTKAMKKLGEVNRLRNKQYLRKIRKVPRKQKKAYLKVHSREIYHFRRLKGDFCKANYKHRHWLYNRPELFNRHFEKIRNRILNSKWMDYNQKGNALACIPHCFEAE